MSGSRHPRRARRREARAAAGGRRRRGHRHGRRDRRCPWRRRLRRELRPYTWRRALHGWPGLRSRDLVRLALLTTGGGRPDQADWPTGERLSAYEGASTQTVPHPDDPGGLLGAVGALRPGTTDAVVSLCRLDAGQVPLAGVTPQDHVEVWLVDAEDANNDLPGVLRDAAEAVRQLRSEGKTVLLHCVHAHTRTLVVAAAYGAMITRGSPPLDRVLAVLPASPAP